LSRLNRRLVACAQFATIEDFLLFSSFLLSLDHSEHQVAHQYGGYTCDCIVKGSLAMSESKDISRRRLDDFLAARLRARQTDKNSSQRPSAESMAASPPITDERTAPVNES
jgi:hypothetical protein